MVDSASDNASVLLRRWLEMNAAELRIVDDVWVRTELNLACEIRSSTCDVHRLTEILRRDGLGNGPMLVVEEPDADMTKMRWVKRLTLWYREPVLLTM